MIRFRITGASWSEMNTAANSITSYHRYEVLEDSGIRQGKRELIRYIDVRIHRLNGNPPAQPKRPDARKLAAAVWSKLVHDTDDDDEAIDLLVKLIEQERNPILPAHRKNNKTKRRL